MSSAALVPCTVCGAGLPAPQISFGKQPPSNRFMSDSASAAQLESHALSLSTCTHCCTIQLFDRMPIEAYRPRYDWLVYNEPEGHLDDVASHLAALPGISTSSRFMGITYKDQSTLTRMANMGFADTLCLQDSDLECTVAPFGLETVQAVLSSPVNVNRLVARFGQADVLLVRHITEHSLSSSRLLTSLSALVSSGGYMMLELPDSQRVFDVGNYPFIWEEHISYFTEVTARRLAQEVNAEVVWLGRYAYPYEDSLNVVLRFPAASAGKRSTTSQVGVQKQATHFFGHFRTARDQWRTRLQDIRAKGNQVAVFGAGHLAAKFINFFELKDLITCVIDDHPQKVGMYMPGSGLPIVPSTQLQELGIRYCVSTLSPESEIKVRGKLAHFFDNGGCFMPAFSTI
ncbi:methyltransferase domain-containing protein [Polynucleobacter sp. UB-Tiil-W10]|uniref:methyltransferase domain-containing protein n=1 Tax=Polynucleobacter sp. UB-Tiil-W10 TaxID=1855648 RepID=UPI001C0D476C|nr:methyltransferase domain-containing protein [Polynucleobacter sp. UB-Tiil-W10]MBU3540824.1 methyltransferase domain-containing protein [Polynucleobacter sp. UB-Tiil-W10]